MRDVPPSPSAQAVPALRGGKVDRASPYLRRAALLLARPIESHLGPAGGNAGGAPRAKKGLWKAPSGVDESIELLLQHTHTEGAGPVPSVMPVLPQAGGGPLAAAGLRRSHCAVGGACPDAVRETLADGLRASVSERLRAAAQEAAARQLAIEVLADAAQHAAEAAATTGQKTRHAVGATAAGAPQQHFRR